MTTRQPTPAQLRVLRNLARGLPPAAYPRGAGGTLNALARRGWVVWERSAWRITEAGREAVEKGGQTS